MNNVEQLFIRACKARDPFKRVQSVYRRFYLKTNDDIMFMDIASLLSNICDEYVKPKVKTMIDNYHPTNRWKYGIEPDDSHYKLTTKILISYIRLAEKDKFPGLTPPRMFR